MRVRPLLPVVSALVLGCAHAPSVSEDRVVHLPLEAQQQILRAQASLDQSRQNLNAAQVRLDDAAKFAFMTARETDHAQTQSVTARDGVELGKRANATGTLRAAQERDLIATRELFAASAKKGYAARLVDLRIAELEQRRAESEQARANFESVKFTTLQKRGLAAGLRQTDFVQAQKRAADDVAQARMRVAGLQGEVETARMAWIDRSRTTLTASRIRDITPPSASQQVDLPLTQGASNTDMPSTTAPVGGANEGPTSAPEAIPQD